MVLFEIKKPGGSTNNVYVKIDDDDLDKVKQHKWWISSYGYPLTSISGSSVYMHKMINETPKHLMCDHINRDRLDNRKDNLRNVTRGENNMNSKLRSDNTTGFKGVTRTKTGKYQTTVTYDNAIIYLGNYETPEESAYAYNIGHEMLGRGEVMIKNRVSLNYDTRLKVYNEVYTRMTDFLLKRMNGKSKELLKSTEAVVI